MKARTSQPPAIVAARSIGVDDHSNDLVCAFGDAGVGDDSHFVDQSVKAYHRRDGGLIMN
ncbi:MAG: hypothetical protein JO334_13705 [Verrucomicrobia bacterium]|nr:hypothetical protein [Verrucomicrobiota bacterium]